MSTPDASAENLPDEPQRRGEALAGIELPRTQPEATASPQIEDYEFGEMLGSGGFGQVYKAIHRDSGRLVAIKVLKIDKRSAENYREFFEESEKLRKLEHYAIVQILDFRWTEHSNCIVMKFMEGGSLAARSKRWVDKQEPWPSYREIAALTETLARALQAAHEQGVYHCDIKPANVLLPHPDRLDEPCLADFGVARWEFDVTVSASKNSKGTPGFASPEQIRGDVIDNRSDLYSLGMLLYWLLAHRTPYSGRLPKQQQELTKNDAEVPPPRKFNVEIPKELEAICLRAVRKKAAERYTTAHDMAEDLAAYVRTLPTPPPHAKVGVKHKGLKSYGPEERDFFLQLLPNADVDDIYPASIRFWMEWLANREIDAETSRIGLLYGPSGCGKSSLIHAGLLPNLPSDLWSVRVEATADRTKNSLQEKLRKAIPALNETADLVAMLRELSAGRGLPGGGRLLIVLDQFEQWLQTTRTDEHSELLQALKLCDGEHVRCLLMVREEFLSAAFRLEGPLGIQLRSNANLHLVDFFDRQHAEKVLTLFGRALKRFPDEPAPLSDEQSRFIRQVVSEMSQDETRGNGIACVRLALYAEMMKGEVWLPPTLRTAQHRRLGFQFLENAFNGRAADPKHKEFKRHAKTVLGQLLPEEGELVTKGGRRRDTELRVAAGLDHQPRDWKRLVHILESELRLITAVDHSSDQEPGPPAASNAANAAAESDNGRYYQLTHDFLVKALREWLNYDETKSYGGRARLCLARRSGLWSKQGESRQLPNGFEYLRIKCFTVSRDWTEPQRAMMKVARRVYRIRAAMTMLLLLLVAFGAMVGWKINHAADLVTQLKTSDLAGVPEILRQSDENQIWTSFWLKQAYASPQLDRRAKRNLQLGLLPQQPQLATKLIEPLLQADDQQSQVIAARFRKRIDDVAEALWKESEGSPCDPRQVLMRADTVRFHLVFDYVASHRSEAVARLRRLLKRQPPAGADTDFKEEFAKSQANLAVAAIRLGAGDAVWPLLRYPTETGDPRLRTYILHRLRELDEPANAAGNGAKESPVLKAIVDQLNREMDDSQLRILVLAVGELKSRLTSTSSPSAAEVHDKFRELYRKHPDAGVHAAAEWSLRQLKPNENPTLTAADAPPPTAVPGQHQRNWYVDAHGHVMVILRGPIEKLTMGTPEHEIGHVPGIAGEGLHTRSIPRSFAVASHETTVNQFLAFWNEVWKVESHLSSEFSPTLEHPMNGVNWFNAAEYCNWLSRKHGLEECYEPIPGQPEGSFYKFLQPVENYLSTNGYRLPTETEWEYVCRAGATTAYSFGDAVSDHLTDSTRRGQEFLDKYAAYGYGPNSNRRLMSPVGSRKPNDFGFLDLHGNAHELCISRIWGYSDLANLESDCEDPRERNTDFVDSNFRVVRGGSMENDWREVRSG